MQEALGGSGCSWTRVSTATPNSGWRHVRLDDPRLSPVRSRLETLRAAGVTVTLVVREFLMRRIAPLQLHSGPMWAFSGLEDPMRLHPERLSVNALDGVLQILIGEPVGSLPLGGHPLYKYKNREDLIGIMPHFD
ncbi:hypothetical protein D1007_12352 [Hordeum vulgare]|nr:hypothetical protein D1007_12352 [Hordeum vulgare]